MITLQIKRATPKERAKGISDSFKFIHEQEFEYSGVEASPESLMRNGFYVKPEDVDFVADAVANTINDAEREIMLQNLQLKAKP